MRGCWAWMILKKFFHKKVNTVVLNENTIALKQMRIDNIKPVRQQNIYITAFASN